MSSFNFNIMHSDFHQKEFARWRDSFLSEGHFLYAKYNTPTTIELFFRHANGNKIHVSIRQKSVIIWKNKTVIHFEDYHAKSASFSAQNPPQSSV